MSEKKQATVQVTLTIHKKKADLINRILKANPWLTYLGLEEFFDEAGTRYMIDLAKITHWESAKP